MCIMTECIHAYFQDLIAPLELPIHVIIMKDVYRQQTTPNRGDVNVQRGMKEFMGSVYCPMLDLKYHVREKLYVNWVPFGTSVVATTICL